MDGVTGDNRGYQDPNNRKQKDGNEVSLQASRLNVQPGFEQQARQKDHEDDIVREDVGAAARAEAARDRHMEDIDQETADDEGDGVRDPEPDRGHRDERGGDQQQQKELDGLGGFHTV